MEMERRLELDDIFREVLGSDNVYFEPPENLKLHYDCIVYERSDPSAWKADNNLYFVRSAYSVTAIYRDPDNDLPYRILEIPLCRWDRNFTSDNLHHAVFTIFY